MTLVRALLTAHALALVFGLGGMLVALPHPELWSANPAGQQVFAFGMQYAGSLHMVLGAATMLAFGRVVLGWRRTAIFFVLACGLSLTAELIGTSTGIRSATMRTPAVWDTRFLAAYLFRFRCRGSTWAWRRSAWVASPRAGTREAAEKVIAVFPDMPLVMQANRGFLRRAVTFMIDQGVDQFLDIGSGIPTAGNVHEVAQRANPSAHIVYVDSDSVAVTYSEALLRDNPRAAVIKADARNTDVVLNHAHVRDLLDFGRPLGVLIVALLHFIPDDNEAQQIVAALRGAMPAGSYMALTHGTTEGISAEARAQIERQYQGATSPFRYRSRSEIIPFFEGLSIVEPGIVFSPLWRPETSNDLFLDQPERSIAYAGVGRKD